MADDYPTDAIRVGAQGSVGFTLDVGLDGTVTRCVVSASSGNQSLDAATCSLLQARARFSAPRNEQGNPVASTYAKRVRWVLPLVAQHAVPIDGNPTDTYSMEAIRHGWEGTVKVGIHVTAAGYPDNCVILSSSSHKVLDDATCYGILKNAKFAPARDRQGQPMADYISLNVNWEIPH